MRTAGTRVDVMSSVYEKRKVPCICPRQHEKAPPIGEHQSIISQSRGATVERVRCSDCRRTWRRINA